MMRLLRDKRGTAMPLAIAVTLSVLLILCAAFEFCRVYLIASGVRDAAQSAIIAVATENYDDLYSPLREGYAAGYKFNGSRWQEKIDQASVYEEMDQLLGLTTSGGKHIKMAGGKMEYALSGLSMTYKNGPLVPSGTSSAFGATAAVTLEVPVSFAGDALPPLIIRLKIRAEYTPKF